MAKNNPAVRCSDYIMVSVTPRLYQYSLCNGTIRSVFKFE